MATSLDGILGEKATRRTALATGLGAAALVVTEFAMGKTAPAAVRAAARFAAAEAEHPADHLRCAECGGYVPLRVQTADHAEYRCFRPSRARCSRISIQARLSPRPSVATILTGLYPSESHVYHLPGRLPDANGGKSLPHLMRAAGYATGASISNPYAYYLAGGLASDYDSLPEPAYRSGS